MSVELSALDIFLWGAAPYISFTVLIVGTAIRRRYFARTWTSKSSEFLDKRNERIWTPLFHLSLLMVFLGHLGGFLIPEDVLTYTFGVSEEMYHMAALSMGGFFGALLVISLIMLIRRRFVSSPRMKANTSKMDKVMYMFLVFTICAGMAGTISNAGGGFDYRATIMPWMRGVLALHPDPSLMVNIPVTFKVHMVSWMLLFAMVPFTRLVHLFSGVTAPFKYLKRSAIVYREKPEQPAGRAPEFPQGAWPYPHRKREE